MEHKAKECNGPIRDGLRDNDGMGCDKDTSAKLVFLSDDYPNNNNNKNNNRNINHVEIITESIEMNNQLTRPIENDLSSSMGPIQNVERIITRATVTKQKLEGAQSNIIVDVIKCYCQCNQILLLM